MALGSLLGLRNVLAVTVTAAVCSPRVRQALRQGAVQGLAGILKAGDRLKTFVNEQATAPRSAPVTEEEPAQTADPIRQ
jgi:hypothetical protein